MQNSFWGLSIQNITCKKKTIKVQKNINLQKMLEEILKIKILNY